MSDRATVIVGWTPGAPDAWLALLDHAVTAIAESSDVASGGGAVRIEVSAEWYESDELAAVLSADGWSTETGPQRRWGPLKLTREVASRIEGPLSEWPRLVRALERAWDSDILPRWAHVRVCAEASWLATCHVDHAQNFVAIEATAATLPTIVTRLEALAASDRPQLRLSVRSPAE